MRATMRILLLPVAPWLLPRVCRETGERAPLWVAYLTLLWEAALYTAIHASVARPHADFSDYLGLILGASICLAGAGVASFGSVGVGLPNLAALAALTLVLTRRQLRVGRPGPREKSTSAPGVAAPGE